MEQLKNPFILFEGQNGNEWDGMNGGMYTAARVGGWVREEGEVTITDVTRCKPVSLAVKTLLSFSVSICDGNGSRQCLNDNGLANASLVEGAGPCNVLTALRVCLVLSSDFH